MAAAQPPILVQAGDDSTILLAVTGAAGYTARAVCRAWPDGPPLQTWSTTDGTAVIDTAGVHLLADGSETWPWRAGEVDLLLTAPNGFHSVHGPWRLKVRRLYSRD